MEDGSITSESEATSQCSCPCCVDFSHTNHPVCLEGSKTANMCGSYSRSIQVSWYSKHPWISVCTSSYKVFCHICCDARALHFLSIVARFFPTEGSPTGKRLWSTLVLSMKNQKFIVRLHWSLLHCCSGRRVLVWTVDGTKGSPQSSAQALCAWLGIIIHELQLIHVS